MLNFDFQKKRTKLPELGSGGGGLGDSDNARKKTFFLSLTPSLSQLIPCLHQPTQKDEADDVPHDAQRHLAQVAQPRLPSLSKPSLERPRLPSSQLGCVPAPCRADRFLQNFFFRFFCIFFFPSHRGQNSRFSVQGRSLARWGSVAARCRSKLCSAQLGYRLALVPRALSFHAEVNFFVKKIIIIIALIILLLLIIIITIVNHQHLILFSACQHK